MSAFAQPCGSCPWRVGVDAWAIGRDHTLEVPQLHPGAMEELARVRDRGMRSKIMGCHLAHRNEPTLPARERLCRGYALSREGGDSLPLRLLALQGEVDLSAICCREPLHPDFAAMLAANPPRRGER